MNDLDQARAVLYGLALGDALGWPIEFLKMDKITVIYGEGGIQEPPDPALVTDETQTSLVIAEALIEAGDADIDTLMRAVTRGLIAWSNSPDNTRAPGHTVTEAVRTLESGVSWQESGIPHAKGNGSAVRVAPIGYLYQNDPERLREVARATGVTTHAHPTAIAAAIACADLIRLALAGVPPEEYANQVLDFLGPDATDEFIAAIHKTRHVASWTDEFAAMEYLGGGWIAEEAVSLALYSVTRYADDFPGALRRAVNIPGDSDSVGCLTGGISAAYLGLDAVPTSWIEHLEHRDHIESVAARLADKKQTLYG
nr:ADP-ribosylglycohydrolase family protein [Anaerolineae bacterium]